MAKKQFQAESKRLLDLMINSIYTHREIFLRELISNASDACDKLYFKSLTEHDGTIEKKSFQIFLCVDKDARTLTITDNGIGMDKQELENNLGVIAQSGSLLFKQQQQENTDVDIIGQFGVGFYSAFMVSQQVTVKTKAYGHEQAWCWQSTGADGYELSPCDYPSHGTQIILTIKDNTEENQFDEFLDPYRIQAIIKKYSDYIRYPIRMDLEKSKLKEGTGTEDVPAEYETYTETETLNSMIPIWRKNKTELTDREYHDFYQEKFMDFNDPLRVIHTKTEGTATYNALLYLPSKAPAGYYTKEYEKGLQLYSSGVLIMEKCADLLPDHFSFVKGLVDSEDLSLNISREVLQHDQQLKLIAKSLEKKIKGELEKMLKQDRKAFEQFFDVFGMQLKFGIYQGYGTHKQALQDLILFHSSHQDGYTTLSEYSSRMKQDQKHIYYATGKSIAQMKHLPQTELLLDKGFEILFCTDDVDEFAIQMMRDYDGKGFQSVSAADLDLDSDEDKNKLQEQNEQNKDLFDYLQQSLDGKVKKVQLSQRLKTHPVCLSSDGQISLEMEKVLNAMPGDQKVKAEQVLELNPSHPVFTVLQQLFASDKQKLEHYIHILYTQALLIEGMAIDDPVSYANAVCDLMVPAPAL